MVILTLVKSRGHNEVDVWMYPYNAEVPPVLRENEAWVGEARCEMVGAAGLKSALVVR